MLDARFYTAGIRALIVGLAREGTALARFLSEHGARVTITDSKHEDALVEGLSALSQWPISFELGGHPSWLLDSTDIVFVSPGVPLDIPLLVEARTRGIPLSSETRLFTRLCPAPIAGITGSSGKTTTTVLIGEMLRTSGQTTWVGGNIGQPLIGSLVEIVGSDAVVMELSSFQLELFGTWSQGLATELNDTQRDGILYDPTGWSPALAGVLNITPNHLDRHGTMDKYVAAKSQILNFQKSGDTAVLNRDNTNTRRMGDELPQDRRLVWFSMEEEVDEGAFLHRDRLMLRLAGRESMVCSRGQVRLIGTHNLANSLAACALAGTAGASIEAMRQVLSSFEGVEHRLEPVRIRKGVRWYNDSKATTPDGTIAALRSFDAPIILLAGGRDKHLPWSEMASLTWEKAHHVILFGEAATLIEQALASAQQDRSSSCRILHAGDLERAVEMAAELGQAGDIVLLSPGGTSYDAYNDYTERGDHFRQLVKDLE